MVERAPLDGSKVVERLPKAFRLESIKSRIVGLALLATLVPSVGMAWISYVQNRAALTDKITKELQSVSAQTAREIDLWIKERLYDVRVFASSYEVTENIELARGPAGDGDAYARLRSYLVSVEERFPDYDELLVVDRTSQPVATSAERTAEVHLPVGWFERVAADQTVIGDTYWDERLGQAFMTVAVPVTAADRSHVGALVATVSYRAVQTILLVFAPGASGDLYVIGANGATIVSSEVDAQQLAERRLDPAAAELLYAQEGDPLTYLHRDGHEVIGTLKRVPRLDWAVVAEIPSAEAFEQVAQLRDLTLLLVLGLLVVVGFTAYRLGLLIVRPLDRLTRGAAEVAAGDLDVDLPVGKGEVGYLTEVFNGMVARLREGRQQLEHLLVTDPLTGLWNRRHLMSTLDIEAQRTSRSDKPFSILLADVDHFKAFNDTHGHVAGDEALKVVATVMQDATRDLDTVSRYGGEEFVMVLPDTDIDGALRAAERIREKLAEASVDVAEGRTTLTVSIGGAEFPVDGGSPETLIAAADNAMYEAKKSGRNEVARATRDAGARKPPKKKWKRKDGG